MATISWNKLPDFAKDWIKERVSQTVEKFLDSLWDRIMSWFGFGYTGEPTAIGIVGLDGGGKFIVGPPSWDNKGGRDLVPVANELAKQTGEFVNAVAAQAGIRPVAFEAIQIGVKGTTYAFQPASLGGAGFGSANAYSDPEQLIGAAVKYIFERANFVGPDNTEFHWVLRNTGPQPATSALASGLQITSITPVTPSTSMPPSNLLENLAVAGVYVDLRKTPELADAPMTPDERDALATVMTRARDIGLTGQFPIVQQGVKPSLSMSNITTGRSGVLPLDNYAGPFHGGVTHEFIYTGGDSVNLSSAVPNVFLRSGGGQDALVASSGRNVIDGGLESNFLVGGSDQDTFFVDGRANGVTWSTVANFDLRDDLTLWGWIDGVTRLTWEDRAGAIGYEGLTLHADLQGSGRISASMTFSGLTSADLPRLHLNPGVVEGNHFLHVTIG